MTRRLYYDDPYRRSFAASVVEFDPASGSVYLDATAFYPTSGGQLHDTGTIGSARVLDVIDEETRIRHVVDRPVSPGPAQCAIDWERRFDHMQQHTGQHLLSAVFHELYGRRTLSVHFGAETSTLDLDAASLEPAQLRAAEDRANAIVFENRPVTVSYHDAASLPALRKQTEREGTIRVVTIEGADVSACGGTHVRSTAEIGPVRIGRLDRVRGNVRVEFTCGQRSLSFWREALAAAAGAAAAASEKFAESEKARRKLAAELAGFRGRELYSRTSPDVRGLRIAVRQVASSPDDELRAEASAFTALPDAVYCVCRETPASLLLAVSAGSAVDAAAVLKPLLEAAGGRGGGNSRMAQGSLPEETALATFQKLLRLLGAA